MPYPKLLASSNPLALAVQPCPVVQHPPARPEDLVNPPAPAAQSRQLHRCLLSALVVQHLPARPVDQVVPVVRLPLSHRYHPSVPALRLCPAALERRAHLAVLWRQLGLPHPRSPYHLYHPSDLADLEDLVALSHPSAEYSTPIRDSFVYSL